MAQTLVTGRTRASGTGRTYGTAWVIASALLVLVGVIMTFVPALNLIGPAVVVLGTVLLVREFRGHQVQETSSR